MDKLTENKAKSLMIQGTMSNVGKSLITAGFCRIFKQDGYKCAPFKSQNMALNSYITEEGLEIGRAQAVQAEAACIKPSALMNPILLKPTTEMGSQVIVNGEVRGNMSAFDYFKSKKELFKDAAKAYDTLANEYDVVVLEGAGSPAEINLNSEDIVNMGMAKYAKSPVILVGDIDRGGVFAQLYGTIMLLSEEERSFIKGFIINKFRGDSALLQNGLRMIEDKTGIPVLGTVPYSTLDIDDEDSLSDRLTAAQAGKCVDIAVIRLPFISNFTDFAPFERFDYVSLRYVKTPSELKHPNLIIIPGTKSTISDLLWMRQTGLEQAVLSANANGSALFGICGGFQMLGKQIDDPLGVESQIKTVKAMGLLNNCTVFDKEKIRKQVSGVLGNVNGLFEKLSGVNFEGYEIHMGKSPKEQVISFNGKNVYGSYVHGLFDGAVASIIVNALCAQMGIDTEALPLFDQKAYKNEQYDKLADILRGSVNMKKIYEIVTG